MTSLTLYQISDEVVAALDAAIDPDTGELLPEFAEKRALFASKAGQVAAYILNLDATASAINDHLKTVERKAKTVATKGENLRRYLAEHMARTGITEIKSEDGTYKVTFQAGRDESVEIEDGAQFPAELCNDPKPPTPSKTKIKAAILAGQPVSGARIVRKDRLVIR